MKIVAFGTAFIVSLCVACCGGEIDDVYGNQINHNISNDNLIRVEDNASSFNLGETIFINSSIQNEQVDSSEQLFYISDYLNEEVPFYYELALYRINVYGNLEKVILNNDSVTSVDGETFLSYNGSDFWLQVGLTQRDDAFVNRFGITVLETGTYYLASNYYLNNSGTITMYTNNINGFVQVFTTIVNANEDGMYEFTVE